MEAVMITWFIYTNAWLKFGYASTDIEQFITMEECQKAKVVVIEELQNKANFDDFSVVCRSIK